MSDHLSSTKNIKNLFSDGIDRTHWREAWCRQRAQRTACWTSLP